MLSMHRGNVQTPKTPAHLEKRKGVLAQGISESQAVNESSVLHHHTSKWVIEFPTLQELLPPLLGQRVEAFPRPLNETVDTIIYGQSGTSRREMLNRTRQNP